MDAGPIYRFGDCEVNTRLRQVRCGGQQVEPQPKAFDVLVYLIEHRDRVVDKDELLEQLWPGVVVSESALTQALRKARSMVGDDGTRQAVIRTVQRRGFRFVCPLDADRPAPAPAAAAAPAVTTGAKEPSVAVLPFADMSPAKDQEYFCDGMAEEIINALTRIPGLSVAARTSSFAFKQRADDVREIARQLGVRSILEGSVRKAGEQLRVTAQLIDARTGFHLWSERWDRGLSDMFAIQDEIAARIAEIAGAHTSTAAAVAGGPPEITAGELHRRGMAYVHRFGQRSQRFAIELFRQALVLDPECPDSWSGLSMSNALLYRYSMSTEHYCDEARRAAARAVEIDPESASTWTARWVVATLDGDFAGAEAAFERAIANDPECFEAHYHFGRACSSAGRFERAAQLYERAAALRRDDYQALVFAAQAYTSLGLAEKARDAHARQLARALTALAADPTDARALSLSASALLVAGREGEARAWTERARLLEPDEPYIHYNAACFYALSGDIDRALDCLDQVHVDTICNLDWMRHDEGLDALRGHPRFEALMARACLPGSAREKVTD